MPNLSTAALPPDLMDDATEREREGERERGREREREREGVGCGWRRASGHHPRTSRTSQRRVVERFLIMAGPAGDELGTAWLEALGCAGEPGRIVADDRQWVRDELTATIKERIMFFDGGMGTLIQMQGLVEKDFRGKGNKCVLSCLD